MWSSVWNLKFYNTSAYCAILRSRNISSALVRANYLNHRYVWKTFLKFIDDSFGFSNLSKNQQHTTGLGVNDRPNIGHNRCMKGIRNIKHTKIEVVSLKSASDNKTESLKNISNMSSDKTPLSINTKKRDDECTDIQNDRIENDDPIIVYQNIRKVEVVGDSTCSNVYTQSKTVLPGSRDNAPEIITLEDEIVECSFDPNKAQRQLLRLNELRQWEYTEIGKECDLSGPQNSNRQYFTVMSYNVLSQDLLESHTYLYYHHNPNALIWERRSERLLEEIKNAAPDILCLQEVQESHLKSFYIPRLKELGYDGIYKKRTGNKPDGVAIYFKVSTFSLVEHTSVEFMQPLLPVLNRDNVALIARFSSKLVPSLPHLCVATTHLLYNPRRTDVKLAQMQLLLAEIERIAFYKKGSESSYYPIILTGDLNVIPKSSVYKLITSGILWDNDVTDEMVDFLGITDNCQHLSIVNNRKKSDSNVVNRLSELKIMRLFNSDNNPPLQELESRDQSPKETPKYQQKNRGYLSHNFILNSVYKHRTHRGKEATTRQDRWVTVDYIFYSCSSRDDSWIPVEGNLKLLARYGLLSKSECHAYGPIPNLASPSDHFPLISKFLLLS